MAISCLSIISDHNDKSMRCFFLHKHKRESHKRKWWNARKSYGIRNICAILLYVMCGWLWGKLRILRWFRIDNVCAIHENWHAFKCSVWCLKAIPKQIRNKCDVYIGSLTTANHSVTLTSTEKNVDWRRITDKRHWIELNHFSEFAHSTCYQFTYAAHILFMAQQ